MKTWVFSATFESDTQPPETVRGEVQGTALSGVIAKAGRQARKQKPTKNRWSSFALVVSPSEE